MASQNLPTKLLYLSYADIDSVNLSMGEIIDAVEFSLIEKAHGRTHMPPKHWIPSDNRRLFSAMSSAVPAVGTAICKWQSGSSKNTDYQLPYLTGLLMLNSVETGLTFAIMDSTWITAKRTAAASAVAMRYLANPGTKTIGVIGCGTQGRMHVEAFLTECSEIHTVKAYDISPTALTEYIKEVEGAYGLQVIPCKNAKEVAFEAQIMVTGGPIEANTQRTIEPGWLEKGALGITIDYDCYWQPSSIRAVDRLFTDDIGQMEHLKEFGYFLDLQTVISELGSVAAGLSPGRSSANETLLTLNLGVAVEDAVIAKRVFEKAEAMGKGTWLDY